MPKHYQEVLGSVRNCWECLGILRISRNQSEPIRSRPGVYRLMFERISCIIILNQMYAEQTLILALGFKGKVWLYFDFPRIFLGFYQETRTS